MKLLRANTAVDVLIGPFVDSTDGNTDETGLTISQADVRLSKNGQNMAQKNDANACTHDELGYYNCPLNATDTNTEGQLDIIVHESGALHVKMECEVLSEAAWDSLFAAKDDGFMDVNVKTIGRADTQETEADNLESACANYSATRGLSGTALPGAAADAAGGLIISDDGGLDIDELFDAIITDAAGANIAADIIAMQGNVTSILEDTGTTIPTTLSTIAGYVDTEVQAIIDELAKVPKSDGTVSWNATALAAIEGECVDALESLSLDHLVAVADADDVVDDSIIAKLAASGATADWSTFVNTTDSLQATRDHIGDGTNLTEAGGDGDHLTEAGGDGGHLTEAGGDGDHLVEAGGDGDQLTAIPNFTANGTLSGVALDDMVDRIYSLLLHKMNVTDADGSVALRNSGDDGDIATGSITDNSTTTVRAALSFS